jgi:hypothetical protein
LLQISVLTLHLFKKRLCFHFLQKIQKSIKKFRGFKISLR